MLFLLSKLGVGLTSWARSQLLDEDGSADEDFWQQEFFAEEGRDEEYEESTEEEDVPDADFSEEVSTAAPGTHGLPSLLICDAHAEAAGRL